VAAMKAAGAPGEYRSAGRPLVALIQELSKNRDRSRIHLRKGGLTLRLEKRRFMEFAPPERA